MKLCCMVIVLSNCRQPHSRLDVLMLKCATWCESIIGCQNVQYLLCPHHVAIIAAQTVTKTTHGGNKILNYALGMFCHLLFKAKNISCRVCGRGFLWWTLRSRMSQSLEINLPVFLAMVCCFAVENLYRVMQCVSWYCHAERYHQWC